ncbi:MAG: Ribonuclease HII [Candidatus Moranbacteria bacterium GW2011_GWF2_35_54]|nr:MAG: Ribonuclease HII [Candidatus Moranbacteria bacterium GW2011_GWF2_35_54]
MKNKVVIESMLNPSVATDRFEVEKKLLSEGYDFVIGVDEAGRGPLAGPVVAAAVAVRNFPACNAVASAGRQFQISNEGEIQNTPSVLRTSPPAPSLKLRATRDFD